MLFLLIFFFSFLLEIKTSKLAVFELSSTNVPSKILEKSLIFNDTFFLVSTQDNHLMVYNISNLEEPPIQMHSIETSIALSNFIISSDNYIIGLGNNDESEMQTIVIYHIQDQNLSALQLITLYEIPSSTNPTSNLICLDNICDFISFIDSELGIRIINLTSKELPQEIPQSEEIKKYTVSQTLVLENEIISTFDDSTIVTLNISNLTNITVISSVPMSNIRGLTSFSGSVVFLTCNQGDGSIYAWKTDSYDNTISDSFHESLKKWDQEDIESLISSPFFYCSFDGTIDVKVFDIFIFVALPVYQLFDLNDMNTVFFYQIIATEAIMLKNDNNYYTILIYDAYNIFKINSFIDLSTVIYPYSISSVFYYVNDECMAPYSIAIVSDGKYMVTTAASNVCYYEVDGKTLYEDQIVNEKILYGNMIWVDIKKRYFMVFGLLSEGDDVPGYFMFIYDYYFESKSLLAKIQISTVNTEFFICIPQQFGDLIYLLPNTWNNDNKIRDYLFVVNISDINNLMIEETNVESGTGVLQSTIGSCEKNNERYIFLKRETDSFISIYRVPNDSYTQLEMIGKIMVSSQFGSLITSKDCNYLYAGGESFATIEILNFSEPKILATLNIFGIHVLKMIEERVFVITSLLVYIFDVSKHFPVLINSIVHPDHDERKKNRIFNVGLFQAENSNYIYKGSSEYDDFGGVEVSIYEEKRRFYIFLKQNKNLIVGNSVSYRYHSIDLYYLYEITGIISSVQLTNTTANFPTKFSLPSWIFFDYNAQKVNIAVPKNYEYENLSLIFEMKYPYGDKPEIYSQTLTFPYAVKSLNYQLSPRINIDTPSINNIQIIINHYPDIMFIFLSFANVFVSYHPETGELIASGIVDAINEMFSKIRIMKIPKTEIYPQNFNLTIEDYLNNDINDKNITYDENTFSINNAPICSIEDLQKTIDNQFIYSVPLKEFSYQLPLNLFSDPDLDALNFLIVSGDDTNLPEWLNFDPSTLKLYGTPLENDLGLLNLSLNISDGYDSIIKNFHINIRDTAPVVSIPIQTQIKNNKVIVGQQFILNLSLLTFSDVDGPNSLKYSVYFEDKNHQKRQLISSSDYWLKFDDVLFSFWGTPSFEDSDDYGNNLTIEFFANDGIKNSSDTFIIYIFPSLKKTNNTDSESFPVFEYYENQKLKMNISVNYGSIIILNDFLLKYSDEITYLINKNITEISLTGNINILNQAVNYIVYRNFSKNTQRITQEIQENISYLLYDDFGQSISGEIQPTHIKYTNLFPPKIDVNLIKSYYLAEIGSNFQVVISKNLIDFGNVPNMSLTYNFTLYNSYNIKQSWIYTQLSSETIQIFTSGNVDDSWLGKYNGILIITDEFLYEYKHLLILEVDYSLLEKFKSYLQIISTIVGPIISVFAFSKFFYLIYNLIWHKEISKKDLFLKVNSSFKIKLPLIEEEFNFAREVFEKIHNMAIKEDKHYYELFFKGDIMNDLKPLTKHNHFDIYMKMFLLDSSKNSDNVICLIEGLLIKKLIEKFPKALIILKEIELETLRNHNSEVDEWYDHFFFDQNLKKELDFSEIFENTSVIQKLNISDYVNQIGTFKSVEKDIYILGHYYNFIFEKTVSKMKKLKLKKDELDIIIKPLILRAIIGIKRGIPFKYSPTAMFLNEILKVVGIRIMPIAFGDSIHLTDGSFKCVKTFEQRKEKKGKCLAKYINKFFINQPYIPINDKSFPDCLNFNLKKGYLIMHGTPYKEEIGKKYIIRICTKNLYNIIQFRLIVSDIDKNKSKANSLTRRITIDPKIKKSIFEISSPSKNIIEEKKIIKVMETEMIKLKSEEFEDAVDEKIEVKIVKNNK